MGDVLQLKVVVDAAGVAPAFAEVKSSVQGLSAGLESAGGAGVAAGESIAGGMRQARGEAMEARHALMGVGEEIGVKMPRFVTTFISHLGGVAPVLASAFSAVAVVGIAEILIRGGKAAFEFYQNVVLLKAGFEALDEIERKLTEDQILLSNELLRGNQRVVEMTQGATAGAKIGLENLGNEIVNLGSLVDANGKQFKDLAVNARAGIREFLVPTAASQLPDILKNVGMEIERVQRLQLNTEEGTIQYRAQSQELQILSSFYETLSLKVQKYQQDTKLAQLEVSKAQDDAATKAIAAAQKAEEASRVQREREQKELLAQPQPVAVAPTSRTAGYDPVTEQSLEQQHTYLKENIEFNKEADKEIADDGKNAARIVTEGWKKGMEDQQRIARSNVSVQEALLASQLADAKEKASAQAELLKSGGAATPVQNAAARAAYDEQATIIGELIGLEMKYRETVSDANDPNQVEKFNASLIKEQGYVKQLETAWNKYQTTLEKLSFTQQMQAQFSKGIASMTNDLNRGVISWINGQETFGHMVRSVWTGIVDTAITSILQVGEKWVVQHVLMAAIDKILGIDSAATAATTAAAQVAAAKTASVALVGLAGSGGVASMAAAPFPIDLTAPAFGASMAGAAAAFLAFEEGGIVPRTDLAMVHKGEMVLPAHISAAVQGAASGGGMGGHTFNYKPTINGTADANMMRSSGKQFVALAMREMRRMNR